jgi:PEP-CTERM motif
VQFVGVDLVLTLKGLVMLFKKLAVAAALALGAVAANAAAPVITYLNFTLTDTTDVIAGVVSAGAGSSIISFEKVGGNGVLGFDFNEYNPNAFEYTLSFYDLAAGSHQLKLVTSGPDFSYGATFTQYGPSGLPASSGTLSLSAVPEPEAYALALAGLSVAGLMGLRRRAAV